MGQSNQTCIQGFDCFITVRNTVKLGEKLQRVVGEPNLSRFVFPDQDTQRQVQASGLLALHQRRASLGVAEDQYLRWSQAQSDLLGSGGMVDLREKVDSLLGEQRLQALDGL